VRDARGHPLLFAHAARRRSALRLSEAVDPRRLSHSELYGDLRRRTGVGYGVRSERREAVVVGLGRTERQFSERDLDILDLVRPAPEDALRAAEARARLVRALAANPPPGSAVVLLDRYGEIEHSSLDAERWLAEHSGRPSTRAGYLGPSPAGWHRRRARRSSACATAGASAFACCPAIHTAAARDRGLVRRHGDQRRGGHRLGAVPQPACRPRAARRLEARLGVRTAAEAVAQARRESA
jgi:hypothetical protein